jgi:hypothetical protein
MTYKILSSRITPDGGFFTTIEYTIDGQSNTTEIATHFPIGANAIVELIKSFVKSEKYKKDALAYLPTIQAELPLNIETEID